MTSRRELITGGIGALLATGAPAGASEPPVRTGSSHFRVGCCAYSYRKYLQEKTAPMNLYQFLDACAAMNLDGVELTAYYFPTPLTAAEVHRIARRAFLLGLDVAGTACGNNFCLPPGEEREKQMKLVKDWIGYAVDMGAPSLRVFGGALPQGVDVKTGRKWVVECLETCLPLAEEKGVMLAMENHGGTTADADGVLAIVEAVRSDWFGLKWDSANFHTADPFTDLKRTAPYAITTHIKTEYAPNGKKQPADLPRTLALLRAVNYRGYLLLEYEAEEEPKVAVPRTIRELQRLAFNPTKEQP